MRTKLRVSSSTLDCAPHCPAGPWQNVRAEHAKLAKVPLLVLTCASLACSARTNPSGWRVLNENEVASIIVDAGLSADRAMSPGRLEWHYHAVLLTDRGGDVRAEHAKLAKFRPARLPLRA